MKTLVRIAGERKWILGRSSHADIIELDVHAVRALCKHWVIIVEQKENEIVIELYAKE